MGEDYEGQIEPGEAEVSAPDAASVPPFTVTVDPNFVSPAPPLPVARTPTLVRWHECHLHWRTSTVAEKLEHLPTGVGLTLDREIEDDADRRAALVALDDLVAQTHCKTGESWRRLDG